jgi:hypothetical protein
MLFPLSLWKETDYDLSIGSRHPVNPPTPDRCQLEGKSPKVFSLAALAKRVDLSQKSTICRFLQLLERFMPSLNVFSRASREKIAVFWPTSSKNLPNPSV